MRLKKEDAKGKKETEALGNEPYGVFKINTSVIKTTVGWEFEVKTTCFSPMRAFRADLKEVKFTHPLVEGTHTTKSGR